MCVLKYRFWSWEAVQSSKVNETLSNKILPYQIKTKTLLIPHFIRCPWQRGSNMIVSF